MNPTEPSLPSVLALLCLVMELFMQALLSLCVQWTRLTLDGTVYITNV